VTYDFCLFTTLLLAYLAAALQVTLAFTPRFSPVALANAMLLMTVLFPLLSNQLSLGTQVGCWLWVGNGLISFILLAQWAGRGMTWRDSLPVLGSLFGLVAFGLHVFVFANTP
jgi:hypothetical protein